MRKNKTLIFAAVTVSVIAGIYIFDYRAGEIKEKLGQAFVLDGDPEQINYVQIIKPDLKIALQKSLTGWALIEPIQDSGNNDFVEQLLEGLAKSRQISIVRETAQPLSEADLRPFGLAKPAAVFNFKNNLGQSKTVAVGSLKNFEGNSYIRIDSENRVLLAAPIWFIKAQNTLIHYREVKLYRGNLAAITKLRVRSLRDDFELALTDGKWYEAKRNYGLDQNKVRELLKKLSVTNIVEYVFEGEPSSALVKEKGLDKNAVTLDLETDNSTWSVTFNISQSDKALFALTERPTFLAKVDPTAWESFGNLTLDQLRDRTSPLIFQPDEVHKIYLKQNNTELNLIANAGNWKQQSVAAGAKFNVELNADQIKKTINKVRDFQISEFVDSPAEREKFEGRNMLILKTDKEKLVLQLNWGPAFKISKGGHETEYYFARTHLSDSIFALEKKLIDSLEFDKLTEAKLPAPTTPPATPTVPETEAQKSEVKIEL